MIDASALIRAGMSADEQARSWTNAIEHDRVHALVPELIYAELAHALARYVRSGHLTFDDARQVLTRFLRLPLSSIPLTSLVFAALAVALERGLSVYDACYVALAESADAVLVTADRRLAAAFDRVELIA